MTSPENGERVSFSSFTESLDAAKLISGADTAMTPGLIKGLVLTADVVVVLEAGEIADTSNGVTPVGITCYMCVKSRGGRGCRGAKMGG